MAANNNGKESGDGGFNFLIILRIAILISMLRAPIAVCSASTNQGGENSAGVSLEVVHRLRLTDNRGGHPARFQSQPNDVFLPAKDGSRQVLGSHSVLVWLGSKRTPLNLVIDTGSDMTWTQCQPCKRCYSQLGPIFDPKTSATYSVVTDEAQCGPGPCEFGMQYADDSFSFGTVATDNLALSRDVVVSAFLFGCGQNNSFLNPQVFGNGTMVDSGRSVTVLPLEAYRALNDSFTRQMGNKYPRAQGDGVLENCYDLSGAAEADIPMVSFRFGASGGVVVDLNRASVVVDVTGDPHRSRACLAFVPDYSPDQMGIFAGYQQQTLEMVYDVAGGKLGFGHNGCA